MSEPVFPRGRARLGALAPDYDLALCDVWGVVHNGIEAYRDAGEALTRFRAGGGRVVLLTNAPRPGEAVLSMLDAMGFPRSACDDLVSSGDVTLDLMLARPERRVFHLGPPRDDVLFEACARRTGAPDPRTDLEQAEICVCTGLDRDEDRPEDYRPVLERMAARGLTMICANPDIVVHVGDELWFCAGALARDYAALGGAVTQAGKPYGAIYDAAFARARAFGAAPDPRRVLAIGDGMGTDMAGAAAQGIDGLFICDGVHRDALRDSRRDTGSDPRRADGAWDEAAMDRLAREAGAAPLAWAPALVW